MAIFAKIKRTLGALLPDRYAKKYYANLQKTLANGIQRPAAEWNPCLRAAAYERIAYFFAPQHPEKQFFHKKDLINDPLTQTYLAAFKEVEKGKDIFGKCGYYAEMHNLLMDTSRTPVEDRFYINRDTGQIQNYAGPGTESPRM